MKLTDQQKHDQLKAAGLLDSTFTQLTRYYGQLLRLDFGTSRRIQSGVSVVMVIADAIFTDARADVGVVDDVAPAQSLW